MSTFKGLAALLVLALLLVPGMGCGGGVAHQKSTAPEKKALGASDAPPGSGAPKGEHKAGSASQ
jgi:hypothetical protein